MHAYKIFDSSAIVNKYKGKYILIKKSNIDEKLYAMSDLWVLLSRSPQNKYAHKLLSKFSKEMFCENATHHPAIQSYYISMWANVDIYFAMNYILSAYCTGFDEVAVVTLLKQLTAFSGETGEFVSIIKAIWEELFHNTDLKDAVLGYSNKNVASYSLLTLTNYDPEMNTLMKLFNEAMEARQQITLSTYHCIVSRLSKISKWLITAEQLSMIGIIWKQSLPLLRDRIFHRRSNEHWFGLMIRVCDRFNLNELKSTIKSSYLYSRPR